MTVLTADRTDLQRPLFQFFTIFNSVDIGKMVWEQYQRFAIPKIENATKEFSDLSCSIPLLSPSEAEEQLAVIKIMLEQIEGIRKKIESENDEDFEQFKVASLAFFNQLDHINSQLIKAAGQVDNVRSIFHNMVQNRKNPAISKYIK